MWECLCDCGNSKIVSGVLLGVGRNHEKGGTRSCGCLKLEASAKNGRKNRKRSIKDAAAYTFYRKFRALAIKRGLEFELTEKEFFNVACLPCAYCGTDPGEVAYEARPDRPGSGLFAHGIDRVNSKIGYVHGNLAPCCWPCNRSKFDQTVNEFKTNIARQYAFMFNKSKEVYMGLDTQDVSYMEAA